MSTDMFNPTTLYHMIIVKKQKTRHLYSHKSDARFELQNAYSSITLWGFYVIYGRGESTEINAHAHCINPDTDNSMKNTKINNIINASLYHRLKKQLDTTKDIYWPCFHIRTLRHIPL